MQFGLIYYNVCFLVWTGSVVSWKCVNHGVNNIWSRLSKRLRARSFNGSARTDSPRFLLRKKRSGNLRLLEFCFSFRSRTWFDRCGLALIFRQSLVILPPLAQTLGFVNGDGMATELAATYITGDKVWRTHPHKRREAFLKFERTAIFLTFFSPGDNRWS